MVIRVLVSGNLVVRSWPKVNSREIIFEVYENVIVLSSDYAIVRRSVPLFPDNLGSEVLFAKYFITDFSNVGNLTIINRCEKDPIF